MQSSRHEHVETLEGIGQIERDGTVVVERIQYRIDISKKMLRVQTMTSDGEVAGLGRIEGHLFPDDAWSLMKLVGESIDLVLNDGRRWACFIQSSGDWNLMNRGGFR